MVNPLMDDLAQAGFSGYWLGIDQAEFATDILFKSQADLQRIYKDLSTAAITAFGATDVMRFLGRKPHGNFAGEIIIDIGLWTKKIPQLLPELANIFCNFSQNSRLSMVFCA